MQMTNGNIFWTKKNKIKNTYPYLTNDISCDILIIGGGITGAITAYYLAKEGYKIAVVEKNIVGYGSTATDTGILDYQVGMDLFKLEKMIGINNAKRIYELCLDAINELDMIDKELGRKSDFRKKDSMYFSNKLMQRNAMIKEYETRKKAGFDVRFIDQNSSINLNSAIITKDGSCDMDPYRFTQELFEYLHSLENVNIYENTNVDSIKCSYESVCCVTNNCFKIKASKLIFANGVEVLNHVKIANVVVNKSFSIVTRPITEFNRLDCSFTAKDMAEPNHFLRFTKDSRILFSGEDTKITAKMADETYFRNLSKDKYTKLNICMNKLIFNIDNPEIEYAFSGTYATTNDSLPIIDEIESMPNCFCNLGFGSNGILYSVIGGKTLKDAVKGLYTKDMKMFVLNRE